MAWQPMKGNRLQWMRVHKGVDPHLSPVSVENFYQGNVNKIKGQDEIFAFSGSSFWSTLLSMWNFLKHLLVSDSFDRVYSLCWDPYTKDFFGVFFFFHSSLPSDKYSYLEFS